MTEIIKLNSRGRPAYRVTFEARQTVERMKFCGESDITIARALGIDADTMRKHFADELADGYAMRRRELIDVLFDAARAGKVAAVNALDKMNRASRAAPEPNIP
ncbi:hypothetical protein [Sphingopyxis witflariensis]|uniref:Uncharacterized protein n=1 Tax=Sphingopyxis witflariensis TaxID=173675 RepID=A0A2D0ANE0_9SPHN|nr:hypothetical protein [Sphingopyxis witflariensis]OWQ95114.1 hypothetical protein CDQ91_14430 [Sphingopyxis witflariensis]